MCTVGIWQLLPGEGVYQWIEEQYITTKTNVWHCRLEPGWYLYGRSAPARRSGVSMPRTTISKD